MRYHCRAVVGKSSSDCSLISDSDLRYRCRSEVGN